MSLYSVGGFNSIPNVAALQKPIQQQPANLPTINSNSGSPYSSSAGAADLLSGVGSGDRNLASLAQMCQQLIAALSQQMAAGASNPLENSLNGAGTDGSGKVAYEATAGNTGNAEQAGIEGNAGGTEAEPKTCQ